MKTRYALLLIFVLGSCLQAGGQRHRRLRPLVDSTVVVKAYTDSLRQSLRRIDSLAAVGRRHGDRPADGRYYRLFAPLTFYHSPAETAVGADTCATVADSVAAAVDAALLSVYLRRPDLVRATETGLRQSGTIRNDMVDEPMRQELDLVERTEPVPDVSVYAPAQVLVKRPNFWTFGGDGNLQLLQNYVSDNWYKGGESNYSMVGDLTLTANYNNKSRVKFENKLEMKLGFQTSQDDTLHKFKTNNDMLRYTGKLGLQAKNNWYYTIQLLAYTQFTQGLKSNDKKVYSDFMSPFNLNVGLGMDYSVATKNNRLKRQHKPLRAGFQLPVCRPQEPRRQLWCRRRPPYQGRLRLAGHGRPYVANHRPDKVEVTVLWLHHLQAGADGVGEHHNAQHSEVHQHQHLPLSAFR